MANRDGEAVFLAKDSGQLPYPHGGRRTVAAPTVGKDEQLFGARIALAALGFPPRRNGLDGKRGGVMAGTDENRAAIGRRIIDAVGDTFAGSPRGEIVIIDLPLMSAPRRARILEVADLFLLFGVDTDDGQPLPLEVVAPRGDVPELAIALATLGGFLVA